MSVFVPALSTCISVAPTAETGKLAAGGRATYSTDTNPRGLAVADLNNDGRLDLVTVNNATSHHDESPSILLPRWLRSFISARQARRPNYGSVTVRWGESSGGFGARTDYRIARDPQTVAVGDVTGDGRPDVVATCWGALPGGQSTVSVLPGPAAGTALGAPANYPIELVRDGTALGDVTGDGRLDLVKPSEQRLAVSVFPNQASGGFGPGLTFPLDSIGASGVALADLNEDGRPDFVLERYFFSTVAVVLSKPGGGYGPATTYPTGPNPTALVVGDATGDGRPDLLTANYDLDGPGSVSVLPGRAGGTFGPPLTYPTAPDPIGLALGDVTGDGRPDVVVSTSNLGSGAGQVLLLPGRAGGGWAPAVPLSAGSDPGTVLLADVNRDQHLDVVVADRASSEVTVLAGPLRAPAP